MFLNAIQVVRFFVAATSHRERNRASIRCFLNELEQRFELKSFNVGETKRVLVKSKQSSLHAKEFGVPLSKLAAPNL